MGMRYTMLHLAALNAGINPDAAILAHLLVRQGGNVNARNADGNTPLHMACRGPGALYKGSFPLPGMRTTYDDVIVEMWRHGANVMVKNRQGCSALDYALDRNDEVLVSILLSGQAGSVDMNKMRDFARNRTRRHQDKSPNI